MRILILNWRDIKNPSSGGAEILTHEIAKRWTESGHNVTQFSSAFEGGLDEEMLDGVKIIRKGHPDARFLFSSVQYLAFREYVTKFKGKFDVVIDEIHGLPFFTPIYVKEKKVVLICEVADELWTQTFGIFLGFIGRYIEKLYLRFLYKNIMFLTISDSSKNDLLAENIPARNITILPMGINFPDRIKEYKKEKKPTLIFVGRLTKSKGVEDAIAALKKVSETISEVKLWIVGRGEDQYVNYLKNIARKFKVDGGVVWHGFVSESKKFELMGKAHILISPSIKEGWGLTVPEAAFAGTPSIVYNSPGLRDVLRDSIFKVIVKSNNPEQIARETVKILNSHDFYKKLELQKLDKSDYSWDKTAKVFLNALRDR